MNLEKLGVLLAAKHLRQWESVKEHASAALRETLLAGSSGMDLVGKVAEQSEWPKDQEMMQHLVKTAADFLRVAADRLESKDAVAELQKEIASLRDALARGLSQIEPDKTHDDSVLLRVKQK